MGAEGDGGALAPPLTAANRAFLSFPRNSICVVQRQHAEQILLRFREHAESWTRVDTILTASTSNHIKFLALQVRLPMKAIAVPTATADDESISDRSMRQSARSSPLSSCAVDISPSIIPPLSPHAVQILEDVARYRWKTLPKEQRDAVKAFMMQKIVLVRRRTHQHHLEQGSVLALRLINALSWGCLYRPAASKM